MKNRASVGIHAGDTVRVWQKIEEKEKIRLQAFEGLVLARKHGEEPGATFTVRRVSDGVGVEKIFPLYSPMIDRIEIVRRSKVRRAKLYHIREKVAREIKHQMRKMKIVGLTTESDIFQKAEASDKKEKAETASQQINTVNGEEKTAVNAQEEKQAPVVEAEEKKE
ncbi:50S ribosomal protein L19 [Candidatus Kaiserbacteria bacterium]|nr:50S ribosomal protein L19 [Candidatus Kaiserbacteria bacterium]